MSAKVLFIIFSLSVFVWSSKPVWINFINQSWDIIIFILILITGLLYSEDLKVGLSFIETSSPLIALPFIFWKIGNLSKSKLYQILYAFSLALIVISFVSLLSGMIQFNSSDHIINLVFYESTQIINLDSTYLSYYLISAITFGFYLLYFDQVKRRKGLVTVVIIFFFIILMLTAGTTAFVNILLVLAFFILKFLTEPQRTNYKTKVFCLSVFFLIVTFYVSYLDLNSFQGSNYWERFVLWEAAIKATPNLLIGAGTGDYTNVLNDYYRSHNLSQFSLSNYNAHNQFIQTLLSNGILGLVALLIMMIRPLLLSIRHQNPLGILVFFSFFIYGLTEVFLGRYQGVVFFSLMHQSFIAYYHSQSKVLAVKES